MLKLNTHRLFEVRGSDDYNNAMEEITERDNANLFHFAFNYSQMVYPDDQPPYPLDANPYDITTYRKLADHKALNQYIDELYDESDTLESLIGLAITLNKLHMKDERDIVVADILDNFGDTYEFEDTSCYAEEFIAVLHFEAGIKFEDGYLVHP